MKWFGLVLVLVIVMCIWMWKGEDEKREERRDRNEFRVKKYMHKLSSDCVISYQFLHVWSNPSPLLFLLII